MLLVWDFDVLNTATAQLPQLPQQETLEVAPLLDVNRLTTPCNCLSYPETSDKICKQSDASESEEENDANNSLYICNSVFIQC